MLNPPVPHAQGPSVTMLGKVAWKLVFERHNADDDSAPCLHSCSRSSSVNSSVFRAALNTAVKSTLKSTGQNQSDDVVYEAQAITSVDEEISVPDAPALSDELKQVLEEVIKVEQKSTTTRTETRLYTVSPYSTLSLYQLYFVAPGIEYDFDVYSTSQEDKDERIDMRFTVQSTLLRFVSKITVQYGPPDSHRVYVSEDTNYHPGAESSGRLGAVTDNNLNSGYAQRKSEAAANFELFLGSLWDLRSEHGEEKVAELVRGTHNPRQEVPYFLNVGSKDSLFKICEVALLRSDRELSWNPQWGYHGMTPNLNGDARKGNPVYLAWKVCYVGL